MKGNNDKRFHIITKLLFPDDDDNDNNNNNNNNLTDDLILQRRRGLYSSHCPGQRGFTFIQR
jgi:hypothetical protein